MKREINKDATFPAKETFLQQQNRVFVLGSELMPPQSIVDAASERVDAQDNGSIVGALVTMSDAPETAADSKKELESGNDKEFDKAVAKVESWAAISSMNNWRRVQAFWQPAIVSAQKKLRLLHIRPFSGYLLHIGPQY
jgi:hypothetical protein